MKWPLLVALVVTSLDWCQATTISELIPRENAFYELECRHPGNFEYWLLHGKGEALVPHVDTFSSQELTVYTNGSIIFKSLKIEHSGIHICIRKSGNTIKAHRVPLKVRALPSTNLWRDVYQSKFLTGLIAAVVCFSLFALTCLLYNNRWRPARKESDLAPIIENGYDNPVLVEGEADASNTKM